MPSNHLVLCRLLLLLPSIFSSIRVFSIELAHHIRWPKYWSFSFSINPSNEYPGLISFRTDWFDFLAVQETLKSLLQHHSSKASIFWHSALVMVQLSHPYMTTGPSLLIITVIPKHQKPSGLNHRHLSHGSRGQKSAIKVSAGLFSPECCEKESVPASPLASGV